MYIDIYKDQMQKAYLFGSAVLYSNKPIPQEDVPQNWFSYEFRGTVQFPDEPYALEDKASYNYAGSVLSPLPLKKGTAQSRLVKDKF
ncbi:MAG: hypothetical protein K2K53_07950, partial [Oscillospiraceae bacterium]|nr:hypothetical protein [Oscillospiraceae bacterium]